MDVKAQLVERIDIITGFDSQKPGMPLVAMRVNDDDISTFSMSPNSAMKLAAALLGNAKQVTEEAVYRRAMIARLSEAARQG